MNEFNSQVCTSVEQSKRLLAMGLKPETANMSITTMPVDYDGIKYLLTPYSKVNNPKAFGVIPAWSLHRLIELLPQDIHLDDYVDTHYYLTIDPFKVIYVNSHRLWIYQRDGGCLYDKLIDTIEWTIKNNFFNKEYLKQ